MAWAHPLPIPGSELSSQPLFSCSPQQEMALQSPCPHRQDICAPDPCILLSLGSCPEHLCPSHPWMVITPGPAPAINIPPILPLSLTQSPGTPAVATGSVGQPPAPGCPGGSTCCPLPAGWDAQSPRGDGASRRLSQRHHCQISSSIFQADPLPPPLQLHSTYKNLRELGRTGRV